MHCTPLRCNVTPRILPCYAALRHTVPCCALPFRAAPCCAMLWCNSLCCASLPIAVQRNAV
eukprot:8182504-Lingulodinium_polyedra.AAC.1